MPTAQALPTRNGGLVFIKDRMTRQFVDGQETDVIDAIPSRSDHIGVYMVSDC